MQTQATKLLSSLGLAWTDHVYEHDPANRDFGMEAAQKLGVAPARVFKTLIARIDGSKFVVAVLPVDAMLDLKKLAGAIDGKRGEMAEVSDAERISGYVHGGISPLGQRRTLPTLIDSSAESFATIFVSGGRRGYDIELSPDDLRSAAAGRYVDLRR